MSEPLDLRVRRPKLELDAWRLAAAIARLRPADEAERMDGERLERAKA